MQYLIWRDTHLIRDQQTNLLYVSTIIEPEKSNLHHFILSRLCYENSNGPNEIRRRQVWDV